MVGPTELLGFLFVFGLVVAVFGAIARAMDSGSGMTHRPGRDSWTPGTHPTDSGGTVVGYGDGASGHYGHPHGGHDVSPGHAGQDLSHSHSSGFDSSTSFDVGFGAGGDGGFSGGSFDGGSCGGCDSGGGGGGGGGD